MTDQLSDLQVPSDAELISRVRGGDIAAYGDLFSRHRDAANRLAGQLIRGPDADDLVADGFAKVLRILQRGGGPDVAFRAYLLTAVRRLHVDKIRSSAKLHSSEDMSRFDPGIPFKDTAVSNFENSAAAKAFASLPERWQLVLWHLEVEGQKPAEIAPLLAMSANSVSALAYRAREGLRQAFLTMHLADISADDCRWVIERLGGYVRKGLARRDHTKVHDHLDECRRCTAMYLELTEVNSNLAGIIAPLLLGGSAAGYLASNSAGAATGLLAVVGRLRDTVATNAGVVAAGAVAAGVVAAATAGILIAGSDDENLAAAADQPRVLVQPASPDSAPTDGVRGRAPESSIARSAESSPASPDAVTPNGARSSSTSPTPAPATATTTTTANDVGSLVPSSSPTPAPPSQHGSAAASSPASPSGGPSTGEPPGTPPPTSPPPTPPQPRADLSISNLSVDPEGRALTISVDGIPPALAALEIDLESQSTTFAGGTAQCARVTPRHAECALARFRAGEAKVPRAAQASHSVTLPLTFPADLSSDQLSVTVTAVGRNETNPDDNTRGFTFTPPPPEIAADLSISDLQRVEYDDNTKDGWDEYHLTGRIGGVPDGLDRLSLDLTGAARFAEPTGEGDVDCGFISDTRVTCTNLTGSFDIDLVVYLSEGSTETVTNTLAVPDGYRDPDRTNNAVSVTLAPEPTPRFDVVLDSLNVVQVRSPVSTVRGTVSGVPDSVSEVGFRLSGNDHARFVGGNDGATGEGDVDCGVVSETLVTCTRVRAGFFADFDVFHPPGQQSETVTVTVVPVGLEETGHTGNNSRDVSVG